MATPARARQQPPPPSGPPVTDLLAVDAAAADGIARANIAVAGSTAQVAGALTAAAVQAAIKTILALFLAFQKKRSRSIVPFLAATIQRQYPEFTEEQVRQLSEGEVAREAAFRAKQIERLRRDLPDALRQPDPKERGDEVQRILSRERRYTQMREEAMSERALADAEYETVKQMSPLGAYWRLSRTVHTHTLDCLAMGEKFWPHEVLEKIRPPLHPGCPCSLHTLDEAVAADWMDRDQIPNTGDAVRRARQIMEQFSHLHEAAFPGELDAIAEELGESVYAYHRNALRFPKGTHQGGEFMPKGAVGTPVRPIIRRALRDLIHVGTPKDRRQHNAGRSVWLRGVRTFIPEQREFARTIGGVHYTSPVGSTRLYRNGKIMREGHPELKKDARKVPFDLGMRSGAVATDFDPLDLSMNYQPRDAQKAEDNVDVALSALRTDVPPVEVGADAFATHSALEAFGFTVGNVNFENGGPHISYHHPQGDIVVTYNEGQGKVKSFEWKVGAFREPNVKLLPEQLTRPPKSWTEFTRNLATFVRDVAAEHGTTPNLTNVIDDPSLSDHTAAHTWSGVTELGADVRPSVEVLWRKTGPRSDEQKRGIYASYWASVHEGLHAAHPISMAEYQVPQNTAMEEALTEELSHHYAVQMLERQGLHDVIEWARSEPFDYKVIGTYTKYRGGLDLVLNEMGVAPEERPALLADLKFNYMGADRYRRLRELTVAAGKPKPWGMTLENTVRGEGVAGDGGTDFRPFMPLTVPEQRVAQAVKAGSGESAPASDWRQWRDGRIYLGRDVTFVRPKRGEGKNLVEQVDGTVTMFEMGGRKPSGDLDPAVPWTATVTAHKDGFTTYGVVPGSIIRALNQTPMSVEVDGGKVGAGDLVSYDGISDGSLSEARITRVLSDTPRSWIVEAVTTEKSKRPNTPVLLTSDRVGGVLLRAGAGAPVKDELAARRDAHAEAERQFGVDAQAHDMSYAVGMGSGDAVTKKPVGELQVGDVVNFDKHKGLSLYWSDLPATGQERLTGKATVTSVEAEKNQTHSGRLGGRARYVVVGFDNGHTMTLHSSSKLPMDTAEAVSAPVELPSAADEKAAFMRFEKPLS